METWKEIRARHKRELRELAESLRDAGLSQSDAARQLRIDPRTLSNYLLRHGIPWASKGQPKEPKICNQCGKNETPSQKRELCDECYQGTLFQRREVNDQILDALSKAILSLGSTSRDALAQRTGIPGGTISGRLAEMKIAGLVSREYCGWADEHRYTLTPAGWAHIGQTPPIWEDVA